MPTPPRRIRYALIAAGAVAAIGVGYAGIASAQASGGEDTHLAAASAGGTATDGATPPVDALPEDPAAPAPSSAAPSTSPSPTASPTVSPRPTSAKPTTKRPTPTKTRTRTTRPTSGSGSGSGSSGGGSSSTVSEVIRLVNAERSKAGCGALAGQSQLHAAAQKHSELQAEKETMSHQLPGEASMGDRVTAEGYRWGGVAENVAAGYGTPAAVMDGWMNSSGHKANILNCGYKHIGVGVKKSAKGTLYWTQNFASPR